VVTRDGSLKESVKENVNYFPPGKFASLTMSMKIERNSGKKFFFFFLFLNILIRPGEFDDF